MPNRSPTPEARMPSSVRSSAGTSSSCSRSGGPWRSRPVAVSVAGEQRDARGQGRARGHPADGHVRRVAADLRGVLDGPPKTRVAVLQRDRPGMLRRQPVVHRDDHAARAGAAAAAGRLVDVFVDGTQPEPAAVQEDVDRQAGRVARAIHPHPDPPPGHGDLDVPFLVGAGDRPAEHREQGVDAGSDGRAPGVDRRAGSPESGLVDRNVRTASSSSMITSGARVTSTKPHRDEGVKCFH